MNTLRRLDFFISYSRRDSEFASALHHELSWFGMKGYLDHADISTGADFSDHIRSAIRHSDALIVILSEAALSSNWVMAEIGMAEALNKRIIPVLAPGADMPRHIPDLLSTYLVLDSNTVPLREAAARIVAAANDIPWNKALPYLRSTQTARRWSQLVLGTLILCLLYVIYRLTVA